MQALFGENIRKIGVRGFPARDISSLGAMGRGPGRFPGLFTWRRLRVCRFSEAVVILPRFSEVVGVWRDAVGGGAAGGDGVGGDAAGGDAIGWG